MTTVKDSKQAVKIKEKYEAEADRYAEDQQELESEAKKLQAEQEQVRKRADRYDLAEVFLEIGLVVTSITLLSGKRPFWYAGLVMAILGTALAVSSALV